MYVHLATGGVYMHIPTGRRRRRRNCVAEAGAALTEAGSTIAPRPAGGRGRWVAGGNGNRNLKHEVDKATRRENVCAPSNRE